MTTNETVQPANTEELRGLIVDAANSGRALEISAGGSKRDIGAPQRSTTIVDLGAFKGVVDYEPSELVLTVRPATPLAELEALLRQHGQMFAFEPWDHGPLFGRASGAATIGGIVAAGVAGSRRVSAGGARDHLLGFTAVSGRGETFKAGGKVVKNVTGYDVSKVMAGSWGQLAAMTELTLKVVPHPLVSETVGIKGLSSSTAIAAMAKAMGSRCGAAAAAHLPGDGSEPTLTLLRLEGFRESVDVRAKQLGELLAGFGTTGPVRGEEAVDLWAAICEARPLAAAETLWRVHLAPTQAASFVEEVGKYGAQWFYDWAGALVWVGAAANVDIRAAASARGGHAMLLRAPTALRETISARHPETPAVTALSARLKQAFDPSGILDPHRFN